MALGWEEAGAYRFGELAKMCEDCLAFRSLQEAQFLIVVAPTVQASRVYQNYSFHSGCVRRNRVHLLESTYALRQE